MNVLEANNHSRTKMFPLGVVVREKLPDLTVPLHRPSICLPARVHSIREQPLHVKPPILPVSLSPLLFQISSYLSQNLITMQKYEWDTAGSCVLSLSHNAFTLAIVMSYYTFRKHWKSRTRTESKSKRFRDEFLNCGCCGGVFLYLAIIFLIIVRLTALTRLATLLNEHCFSLFDTFKVQLISYLRWNIWLKSDVIYDVCAA